MVEMRDGKSALNEKEMDLDFMWVLMEFMRIRYAVPTEIQEIDKKQKRQNVDEEVLRFQARYLNPQKVVSELPPSALEEEEESSEDEQGRPKDPRKNVCCSCILLRRIRWKCSKDKSKKTMASSTTTALAISFANTTANPRHRQTRSRRSTCVSFPVVRFRLVRICI